MRKICFRPCHRKKVRHRSKTRIKTHIKIEIYKDFYLILKDRFLYFLTEKAVFSLFKGKKTHLHGFHPKHFFERKQKIGESLVFPSDLWYNKTNKNNYFSHSTKRLSPLNGWYVYFFSAFCYDECERRRSIEWIRSRSVNSFHNNEKNKI